MFASLVVGWSDVTFMEVINVWLTASQMQKTNFGGEMLLVKMNI